MLLVAMATASIFVGTRPIPPRVTLEAIVAFDPTNTEHLLVRHLRVPRVLLGIVVGCALGVAGAIMQALTRNPLADPGILGVNAGATLAIVAAIAFFGIVDVSGYLWFGLAGAALAGAAVYSLGGIRQGLNPVRLVLAGSALSVVLLALTQIITVNSDEQVFDQFRHWVVGSLQGRGFNVLLPTAGLAAVALAASIALARMLDAMALGQDTGKALGANPRLVWIFSALIVIFLAGTATAAAGPISFVGLTAPHVARFVVGPDHRWLLPFSMIFSALMVVGADMLGRLVGHPGEVAVGIMVALIGGPFFIFLVQRWRIARL
ncbi:Fe(3+)-siderophore ABC transporter permease [Ectothiorhodospira shaposhnikovii]|uniref:FecCD family ABC transporter permease n=1 Tax=Ectothiorhodospira shaposhnikovii TaxID=1054 RepID=UPI0019084012|nr:iron ABC transporter permease [Ectothiorhodospira shaposhnikovii]MBK1674588.1 Fe(3+)-siderophore ABC transporter permease [Ectothiorhodospira shaposhnikovii]